MTYCSKHAALPRSQDDCDRGLLYDPTSRVCAVPFADSHRCEGVSDIGPTNQCMCRRAAQSPAYGHLVWWSDALGKCMAYNGPHPDRCGVGRYDACSGHCVAESPDANKVSV